MASIKSGPILRATSYVDRINQEELEASVAENYGLGASRYNDVILINISAEPYQKLVLQNRPNELNISPQSTWASINTIGRNNPFMMYLGGEDIVSFDISWYANDPLRRDEVIMKCKLLERWSKADGYDAAPPIIHIQWGTSGIFDGQDYILESAKYVLTHFQDRMGGRNGIFTDLQLYPNCATQSLTFKKVTNENTTHEQILPLDAIRGKSVVPGESNRPAIKGITV